MPKALSLKRSQDSDMKSQKSITQFFKTANKDRPNGELSKYSKSNETDVKYTKRKALSPDNSQPSSENNPLKKHKTSNINATCDDYFENSIDNKKEFTQRLNGNNSKIHTKEKKKNFSENGCVTLNINKKVKSPTKSPKDNLSPLKVKNENLSPGKPKPISKEIQCEKNEHLFSLFEDDEWDFNDMELTDSLDLSVMQRCEIISIEQHQNKIELKLKNDANNRGSCFVEGIWLDTPLEPGEIVSIIASRDASGHFIINNTSGLLVLRPDHLISTTSVVAGVFCKRKAVLQERWRGIDSANKAMTMGILVHELVQKALTCNISNRLDLNNEVDIILKDSIQMLYDSGVTEDEAREDIAKYVGPLEEFMLTYVSSKSKNVNNKNKKWNGVIDKVLDIEENVCCPKLGLKGKIDATLQVNIHERGKSQLSEIPLELKSGRPTVSAEHRGQLVLYGMMLSLQRKEDPATALQKGLLLYLKERVELHEVSCGYVERLGLVTLRNDLARHLAPPPRATHDKLVDIEDTCKLQQQSLPEPINHHNACSNCAYLTICSLHLWHTDGPKVTDSHPLSKLREQSLGHLSLKHIEYFLHWTSLLKLEEKAQMSSSPLHSLWTESEEKRSKRGTCAANLKLDRVTRSGDRFLHIFLRDSTNSVKNGSKTTSGPQDGDFSIVSIENRPWIAAGVVTVSNNKELHILLERDLSQRLNKQTLFHIDIYESYATTVQNLTNLGVLMEDSERATKLRKLIIDASQASFAPRLPREVGRVGTRLMRALNIEQQRAVLRVLAADTHALLRGLPGTGKTQTISVLIQMLVALKQRVLVTAHTHSAVDTVLSRLPESLRVLRLGASSRVAPEVASRSEHNLIQSCQTKDQLSQFYDSMEVVGVTCLGATHPMLSRTMFDVCIVDEATQVLQCTVLRPLFAANRFVLVGDPEQLPPVVRSKSARRLGMEESLFHRLMKEEATSTLRLQYRMNQALVDVANKVAYNDTLKCANQKVADARLNIDLQKITTKYAGSPWLLTSCSPELEHAAVFLNMNSEITECEKTLSNTEEACVVLALVEGLTEGGVSKSEIGVIAPYREQVSLLRRALSTKGVEVSTVDQFQGRDKSVILYSCTRRDNDGKTVKDTEILNDQRRLAVSVTRAKHKLIIVGDLHALQKYTPLLRLIEACKTIHIDNNTIAQLSLEYKSYIS